MEGGESEVGKRWEGGEREREVRGRREEVEGGESEVGKRWEGGEREREVRGKPKRRHQPPPLKPVVYDKIERLITIIIVPK